MGLSFVNPSTIVTLLPFESLYSFSDTYNLSFGEILDPFKKDFKTIGKFRLSKDKSMVKKKRSVNLNNFNGKISLFNPFYSKSHSSQILNLNSFLSECHHKFLYLLYQNHKKN